MVVEGIPVGGDGDAGGVEVVDLDGGVDEESWDVVDVDRRGFAPEICAWCGGDFGDAGVGEAFGGGDWGVLGDGHGG